MSGSHSRALRILIHITVLALALFALHAALAAEGPSLTLSGIAPAPVKITLDELRKLPLHKVSVTLESGKPAEFEGVALGAVLAQAGLPMGKTLRGKRLAEYLVVTARDGYAVTFALPELDSEFTDRQVLLCFTHDGAPMADAEGPLRLVIPGEKRPARWVRQVNGLTLKRDGQP